MAAVTDDELVHTLDMLEKHKGVRKDAAAELGIDTSTLRRRVNKAIRRNLAGSFEGDVIPEGYTLGKVTTLRGPNGTVMEWQHKLPDAERLNEMFEELIKQANAEITPLPVVPLDTPSLPSLLTLYPVVDVHLGLYAWHKESGENYDLDIAKEQFLRTTTSLMQTTPASHTALIMVLGDFYHADNNRAETEKSRNHLDVDGRHDKVLHLGAELIIWQTDMALQKHKNVVIKVMRGNHDPNASKALAMTLYFRYQGNDRVTVDRKPVDLWAYEWGVNMLAFTHGDNVKAEKMPGAMAGLYPEMWGRTKCRFGFSGHYHRRKSGPLSDEVDGAEWEILPAFTAKDAWNRSMGFSSRRVIQAITFHATEGRKSTNYVNI